MDQAIKTMINLVIVTIGVFLLISCLTFYALSNNARDTLNATVEYLEIYGYQQDVIDQYANQRGIEINVAPLSAPESKTRYEVTASFSHIFAWINLSARISYTATTRAVEY